MPKGEEKQYRLIVLNTCLMRSEALIRENIVALCKLLCFESIGFFFAKANGLTGAGTTLLSNFSFKSLRI